VEENTPKEKTEPEKEEEAVTPGPPTLDLTGIDPKALAMAKKFGIPLDKIIDYLNFQEARMATMEKYLKETLPTDMKKAFQEGLNSAVANIPKAQPGQPAQGGGLMSFLSQLPPGLLTGGGGMDDFQKKYMTKMMDLQFERLQADVSFTRVMENYIKSKFASKVGESLTKELLP